MKLTLSRSGQVQSNFNRSKGIPILALANNVGLNLDLGATGPNFLMICRPRASGRKFSLADVLMAHIAVAGWCGVGVIIWLCGLEEGGSLRLFRNSYLFTLMDKDCHCHLFFTKN